MGQLDCQFYLWEYEGMMERPIAPSPMEVTAKTSGNTKALKSVRVKMSSGVADNACPLKKSLGPLTGHLWTTAGKPLNLHSAQLLMDIHSFVSLACLCCGLVWSKHILLSTLKP